jgi:hypothetical protein
MLQNCKNEYTRPKVKKCCVFVSLKHLLAYFSSKFTHKKNSRAAFDDFSVSL